MKAFKFRLLGLVSLAACNGNLDVGRDTKDTAGRGGETPAGAGGDEHLGADAGRGGGRAGGGRAGGGTAGESYGGHDPAGGSAGYQQGGAYPLGGVGGGYVPSAGNFPFGGHGGSDCSSGGSSLLGVGGLTSSDVPVCSRGGSAGFGGYFGQCAPPPPEWRTSCPDCKSTAASGVWEGYEEDFFFRPVHKWRVVIDGVDGQNVLSGAITFGDAKPLEPASDPDGQYPPSEPELPFQLRQGATYTIVDGAASGNIVRFEVAKSEVMKSWCELQTPYQVGEGAYYCLPSPSTFGDGCGNCLVPHSSGAVSTFPWAKCSQCQFCACDESSCTADRNFVTTFDLELDAEAGTLTGSTSDGRSLRLTRVEDTEP